MRHIPTALYIDTEFFKRQGLRFDTKPFLSLRYTFVKGGLRLLIPEIMKRELFRHFSKLSDDSADKFIKAASTYPINNLNLTEIPTNEELKIKCLDELMLQWSTFKDYFVVEKLPITGNLADVVDWYFEILPPFSNKKPKEFPDALIISALDQYHKKHNTNIAVVGLDDDFRQACLKRRYIMYFNDLQEYIEAFQPELSGKERLPSDFDPTKPITTEDLTELKAILSRGEKVTPIEMNRVLKLLKSRGSNYDYFFQNADNKIWLKSLSDKGFFLNPPNVEQTAKGHYVHPYWPPLDYLIRVFDDAYDEVLNIISEIPKTDNIRVLEGLFKIVMKANSADVVLRFSGFILAYVENCQWCYDSIISFLKMPLIFDPRLLDYTSSLILKIVEFRKDPMDQEKRSLRKENPEAWGTLLEPKPSFDKWEYQKILQEGIRPLAEIDPYKVARILIDAVASMIRLGMHTDTFEKGKDEDLSEMWCRRLNKSDREYIDVKESLVHTLTYACEQLYNKKPESIDALDQALRNQRWKLFKRLRQHLYASNPNNQTLPWIRELILEHKDYNKWEHHYEFQLMIRKSCEHFNKKLLSYDELEDIIKTILSGPAKEDFLKNNGPEYTDEAFQNRRQYFHFKQLRPFSPLLTGEFKIYFEGLERDLKEESISDDNYSPYGGVKGGFVSYRSPKNFDELEILKDKELLRYINEWEDESRDKDDWLIEINISALADEFKTLFNERIIKDDVRLSFWMENRNKIERPIYINSIIKVMQEQIKERNFENIDKWIEFCSWVLSNSNKAPEEQYKSDKSRIYPDWDNARRSILDFIDLCTKKEINVPITIRDSLANLLEQLCNQDDWRLDNNQPVLLNRDDPIAEAINNNRSRAIESLVKFGFWVRRYLPEDKVIEMTEIISNRINENAILPLTRPEYAILGMQFGNICIINKDWAIKHLKDLFPRDNNDFWQVAFGSYILYNYPAKLTFEILQKEFEYAIENLSIFISSNQESMEIVDRIGQHFFTYYLWGVYPMKGHSSFLERFYEKTNDNKKRWANLFNHVGRSLSNSGKNLDQVLLERSIDFFEWRFEVGEVIELCGYNFWLDAECFKPEWRLQSFSKILDFQCEKNDNLFSQIKILNKLLQNNTKYVVECFAKITDRLEDKYTLYFSPEDTKPILIAGLKSDDSKVRENAERAQDNLLKLGLFNYLEIE